jgi:hypothetical protein
MDGAGSRGRFQVAIGSFVTITLATLLTIGTPQALADIGATELLEPPATEQHDAQSATQAISEPVAQATGVDAVTEPLAPAEGPAEDTDGALEAAPTVATSATAEEPATTASGSPVAPATLPDTTVDVDSAVDPSESTDDAAGAATQPGSLVGPVVQATAESEPVVGSVSDASAEIVGASEVPVATPSIPEAIAATDVAAEPVGSIVPLGADATTPVEILAATTIDAAEAVIGSGSTLPDTPVMPALDSASVAVREAAPAIDPIISVADQVMDSTASVAETVSDPVGTVGGTIADPVGTVSLLGDATTPVEALAASTIDAAEAVIGSGSSLLDTTVTLAVDSASAAAREAAPAIDPIISVADQVMDSTASVAETVSDPVGTVGGAVSDPVGTVGGAVSDPVGTVGGAVSDPVGTVGGAVSDPVGTVGGAVSDPVGTVGGAVSDPVGTVGGAVSGTADALAAASDLVTGGTAPAATSGDTTAGSDAEEAYTWESGSMTARQRDPRTPWSAEAVELMAARPDVAGPDIGSQTADCPAGGGGFCSTMLDVLSLGSLVDAVTSVIRSLALTGLTLLPWVAATLILTAIGVLGLRLTRERSGRTRPIQRGSDAWAYPEVVR